MAQDDPKPEGGTVAPARWLNATVFGIGMASLFSDWSHEIATALMPAFMATMGAAAAWVGVIEGVSDGLSSVTKMASGYYTDRLARQTFFYSIVYLALLFAALLVDHYLLSA